MDFKCNIISPFDYLLSCYAKWDSARTIAPVSHGAFGVAQWIYNTVW